MSDLQIGLLGLGAVVLLAVAAWARWRIRQLQPRQADATVDADLPAWAKPVQRAGPAGSADGTRREPGLGTRADPAPSEPADDLGGADDMALPLPPPPAGRADGLDVLIDSIAPIQLETNVSGDAALAAMPASRRAGTKPLSIEAFNVRLQAWEAPAPGQRYGAFQAGVQLANRHGALNEIEFSEFVVKAQAFADAVGGTPDFPDMRTEVARARELDAFASAHDAQLTLVLRAARTAWSPGYVLQQAQRVGFVPGSVTGRLVLPSATPGLPPVLSLSFSAQAALNDDPANSALREVALELDVALVDRSERPFVRLRETAQALCAAMDAVLVDDAGHRLGPDQLDVIGGELDSLYARLAERDLAPGSALARRLFS
jgi:hypothetical protein